VYHTVRPGQTLYRISRVYGVNQQYLARINGITDPNQLRVGERLYIPGAAYVHYVPQSNVSPPPEPRHTRAHPVKKAVHKPPHATHVKAVPHKLARAPKASGLFSWPLHGKVVDEFGKKNSAVGKGIEIFATTGASVKAAAAGRVIYSGRGIRSYGNLIIVKHDNSFFTVYGFNRKNLVKVGNFVSKGERIALVGAPPDGGGSRLYFEIRYGKDAVNPIFYLP